MSGCLSGECLVVYYLFFMIKTKKLIKQAIVYYSLLLQIIPLYIPLDLTLRITLCPSVLEIERLLANDDYHILVPLSG